MRGAITFMQREVVEMWIFIHTNVLQTCRASWQSQGCFNSIIHMCLAHGYLTIFLLGTGVAGFCFPADPWQVFLLFAICLQLLGFFVTFMRLLSHNVPFHQDWCCLLPPWILCHIELALVDRTLPYLAAQEFQILRVIGLSCKKHSGRGRLAMNL